VALAEGLRHLFYLAFPFEARYLLQSGKVISATLFIQAQHRKAEWVAGCFEQASATLLCVNTPVRSETHFHQAFPDLHFGTGFIWAAVFPMVSSHSHWSACSFWPCSFKNLQLKRNASELKLLNNFSPPFLKPVRMFAKTQTAWGGVRK
jgi:hypothetical protein